MPLCNCKCRCSCTGTTLILRSVGSVATSVLSVILVGRWYFSWHCR